MRTLRISDEKAILFITAVTHERRKWFSRPEFAQAIIAHWHWYSRRYDFQLFAYCVLPDHYHSLIQLDGEKTISQILHAIHSYTATAITTRLNAAKRPKVFQKGTWSEVIRSQDMYWQKAAYILMNPWRAGMVPHPLTPYPHSNLQDWLDAYGQVFMEDLFSKYRRWGE